MSERGLKVHRGWPSRCGRVPGRGQAGVQLCAGAWLGEPGGISRGPLPRVPGPKPAARGPPDLARGCVLLGPYKFCLALI